MPIRAAKPEELRTIFTLSRACGPYTKKLSEVRFIQEYFTRGEMLVITHADVIVGFALIRNLVRKPYTSIYYLGVHPTARGRGLGKRLLTHIELQSPHAEVRLGVDEDNTESQAFWKRCGFVQHDTTVTKRGSNVFQMKKEISISHG